MYYIPYLIKNKPVVCRVYQPTNISIENLRETNVLFIKFASLRNTMTYWKNYWNSVAQNKSPFIQVQRDGMSEVDLLKIQKHVCLLLDLKPNDDLLDLCCGNGLLTNRLTPYCKSIIGIDFSTELIKSANKMYQKKNLNFIEGDIANLSHLTNTKFDKILLYFSFQYFNSKQGSFVVSEMKKLLKPGGLILIGDIPDKAKFWCYYDSFLKRAFYFKQWLFSQPKMGKFWSKKEMGKLAKQTKLKGSYLVQKQDLPNSHYRFDYIFRLS